MLTIKGLSFDYVADGVRKPVLKGLDLSVTKGEFFTLLGGSGCGKTTALRSVAGLEEPSAGSIAIGGTVVVDVQRGLFVPPQRRDVSMVFQSYAIWPHMSVAENVGFPLETAGLPRSERRRQVHEALALVGLDGVADRSATLLSGGQQQRVALARAFVKRAGLLLLDEPLSNLDARLRTEMRGEMKRMQREIGVTTLYVTHDQEEALAMSDRIAILREGEIVEIGTPEELYFRPRQRYTAEFLGRMLVLPASSVETGGLAPSAETALGRVMLEPSAAAAVARPTAVAVRPEHIGLTAANGTEPGVNRWRGRIVARSFSGKAVDYEVAIGAIGIPVETSSATMLEPGADVDLEVAPRHWTLLSET